MDEWINGQNERGQTEGIDCNEEGECIDECMNGQNEL